MRDFPKITFGIIVLNGQPLTKYNLRSLYPFAHQIIIAEGASPKATAMAGPDGHSDDGTLDALRQFKEQQDPEDKIIIVTAEDHGHPNGFWPGGKDEQSQAYAQRATGDYLWQVDIDEFYQGGDLEKIGKLLCTEPNITQISLPFLNFWGGFDYWVDGLFLRRFYREQGLGVRRIFKWGPGYRYISHRPPTVVDAKGVDLALVRWIKGDRIAPMGVCCYHYATLFGDTVGRKMRYYSEQKWPGRDAYCRWYETTFAQRIEHPFRIHHVTTEVSWLNRFTGTHPPQIRQLIADLPSLGRANQLRNNSDVEQLLGSWRYRTGVEAFKTLGPALLKLHRLWPQAARRIERTLEHAFAPGQTLHP